MTSGFANQFHLARYLAFLSAPTEGGGGGGGRILLGKYAEIDDMMHPDVCDSEAVVAWMILDMRKARGDDDIVPWYHGGAMWMRTIKHKSVLSK